MLEKRNLSLWKLTVNLLKMYCGVFILNVPQGTARIGIMGSIIGMADLVVLNILSTYMIIKARNRYKMHNINSLSELALVTFGTKMKYFTDFLVISYATGMILSFNVYFKTQMKKSFCPILFEEESDSYSTCMASNGYWFVLAVNLALIPAIMQPSLSRLAYFSAFTLFAMVVAVTGFYNEIKFM